MKIQAQIGKSEGIVPPESPTARITTQPLTERQKLEKQLAQLDKTPEEKKYDELLARYEKLEEELVWSQNQLKTTKDWNEMIVASKNKRITEILKYEEFYKDNVLCDTETLEYFDDTDVLLEHLNTKYEKEDDITVKNLIGSTYSFMIPKYWRIVDVGRKHYKYRNKEGEIVLDEDLAELARRIYRATGYDVKDFIKLVYDRITEGTSEKITKEINKIIRNQFPPLRGGLGRGFLG